MPDPNPYEPPQEAESLTPPQIVKRGLGFGVILLLTPLATFAAFFASCSVSVLIALRTANFPEPVLWTLIAVPPAIVFVAMAYWAVRARQRQLLARDQSSHEP